MNKRKIKDKYFIERLIKVCTAFLMILSVFFVNKKLIVNEVHAESNTRIEYAEVIEEKYKSITVSASWVMMLGGSGMHSWNWAWVDLTSMTAGMDDMDWHKWEHLIWENDSSAIVSDTRVGGGWVATGTTIEETHTFSYNDNLVSMGVIHKNAEAISLAGADLHPSVSYDFYRGSPETGTGNTTGSYDIVYDGGVSTFNFNHNSTRTTEEPVLRIYKSGAWESPRMDWGGGKLTNDDKKKITSAEYMVERKKTTYQRTVTDYYTPKVKIGTGAEVGGQKVANATSGTTENTAPDIEVLVGSTWSQNIALADVVSVKSGYNGTAYNGYGGAYPGTFTLDDSAITAVLVGGKFAVASLNQTYEISYKAVDADGTWTTVKRNVIVRSSLQSGKNANVTTTKPGDIFTYYIPIKNNAVAATIDVTDTIHSGLEILSTSHNGVVAGQTITWSNLSVPAEVGGTPGELILSVVVKVKADNNGTPWNLAPPYDTLDNTATVTEKTDPLNPVVTNPSTQGPQVVPDKKDKEVTSAPTMGAYYNIGDTISYKINFKNEDNVAKNIRISDDVPLNTELVPGSAKAYDNTNTVISTANIVEGNTITYDIPNVAAGDSGYVVFDVKVKESAFGNTIKNKAKITIGNDNVVINTNTTETPVVNKKSSANLNFAAEGEANQGGVIKYTINYEVPEGKTSVHITDDIPTNALYVAGSITGTGADDSAIVAGQGQLKWDITGLNPGDKGSVGFTIKVPNDAIIGSYIKKLCKNRL